MTDDVVTDPDKEDKNCTGATPVLGTGGTKIPDEEAPGHVKTKDMTGFKPNLPPTLKTTLDTVVGYTLTSHGPYGFNPVIALVRVLLINVTSDVPNHTCPGKVNATTIGGVEVVALELGAGGPNLTNVSLICNDLFEIVLCLPSVSCDGPATGEGVVRSASEETEYVPVCGVKTHRETVGIGTLVDVHYSIVLYLDGPGVKPATCNVSEDVETILEDTDHTNAYGILMLAGDTLEAKVTKEAPGDYVHNSNTSLMKLTIGYSPGVVGVTEVTPRTKVTNDGTTFLITNYVDGDDDFETDHKSNPIPNKV